jgi:hypothetical protein
MRTGRGTAVCTEKNILVNWKSFGLKDNLPAAGITFLKADFQRALAWADRAAADCSGDGTGGARATALLTGLAAAIASIVSRIFWYLGLQAAEQVW